MSVFLLQDHTYSYHSILLNSQDFLSYLTIKHHGLDSKNQYFRFNLGLEDYYIKQSPKRTTTTSGTVSLRYFSKEIVISSGHEYTNSEFIGILSTKSNTNRYFEDKKGIFLNFGFSLFHLYHSTDKSKNNAYIIPVGLGYGRIVGVRNVVQAYVISKETGAELSTEKLLELAVLIEKHNNGFYRAEFRDDSDIHLYKDILELIGSPEIALKIKQIIASPI